MIEIKPDSLYTRLELVEMFGAMGIDWDTVAGRTKPRRIIRGLFLGSSILASLRQYNEETNLEKTHSDPHGKKPTRHAPTSKIFDRLLKETRRND